LYKKQLFSIQNTAVHHLASTNKYIQRSLCFSVSTIFGLSRVRLYLCADGNESQLGDSL